MTHIEILRTFNNWRRDMVGEKTLEEFGITPSMIGEALDAVIKDAERYQKLKDAWGDDFLVGYLDSNVHPSEWDAIIDSHQIKVSQQ